MIASRAMPLRIVGHEGHGVSVLRTERSIALIRVALVAIVTGIYVSSLGIQRSLGPGALFVLVLSAAYAITCVLPFAGSEPATVRVRALTLLVDIMLITFWVHATGGPRSEFWTLYLIVIVSAALRFGLLETMAVAMGLAVLHVSAMYAWDGLSRSQLLYRPTLMMVTAFAVGVLAYQRAMHSRERREFEALAQERTLELGQERAEVERLRRVDLARSEFVAVAAHEFRTPLTAILGVLSTLRTHGMALDTAVREELLDGATGQTERLARLVEDLLTVARIEDGVLRLNPESVDPRNLLVEAEHASGTSGRVQVELHRVDELVCDADAVIRVLTNLLDNARKYSPEGARIMASISQDDRAVRFAIRDAGPGIPPEDRESIFERFRRVGNGDKPGAGLGLYICRGLVEAHGGTLTVGDAPEGGAEFAFTIPRRTVAKELETPLAGVTEITAAAGGMR
ncbi:MAG TPA: ATP-binding protein [Actinomycetota bacterium]|nr:ATP-binding protein [Actinomycetota bacterium]